MRIAVIDRLKCKAPKDCPYLCMKVCPVQRARKDIFSISDKDQKPLIEESLCIGCGICVKKCPFGAIHIVNLPDELESEKVFQYGPNTFRLYRLPIPRKGKILGILGPNGIGKTTAIRILSGILKPNFGKYDSKISEDEIINNFKGTELQSYFLKLYSKELKISLKPQEILLIAEKYKGKKVKELLQNVGELREDIINSLGISNILDRNVEHLSGGELQKIAIAAAFMKNADVYLIDEPSAFLDIRERLRISYFIREKIDQSKYGIVVEHDLVILDYLSDMIHIVYGKPKVYGIFSYPLSSREGINQYIDGYLRRENMRIRDKPLRFSEKSPVREKPDKILISWSEIIKRYESFELVVSPGEIGKGEIVGILGPNGIGKTTFARILAGEIKPDSGEISGEVTISYKPQYIKLSENLKKLKVRDFLFKINEEYRSEEYMQGIIHPLGVDLLFDKTLGVLSGGELQAVMIVACLLRDADIYLLDEPSAFLDVEQRINLANVLREYIKSKEKSAFVIDHDIILIDYISDSLIVFTGESGRKGYSVGPVSMEEGMNMFLKDLGITFRRDKDTKRPRMNKPGSLLDRQQKATGKYYYTK